MPWGAAVLHITLPAFVEIFISVVMNGVILSHLLCFCSYNLWHITTWTCFLCICICWLTINAQWHAWTLIGIRIRLHSNKLLIYISKIVTQIICMLKQTLLNHWPKDWYPSLSTFSKMNDDRTSYHPISSLIWW